jgi:hypothetical protein
MWSGLDLLQAPSTETGSVRVLRKDSAGAFVEAAAFVASSSQLRSPPAVWIDADGDNDLDVLTQTSNGTEFVLLRNQGCAFATDPPIQTSLAFLTMAPSQVDIDGDGDTDFLVSGWKDGLYATYLYLNDGAGRFVETNPGLPKGDLTSAAWGDADNDGDLDLLLTGGIGGGGYIGRLYLNDGQGGLTFKQFLGGVDGVAAWGDPDLDGDLDVLLTGGPGNVWEAALHLNNGLGDFTAQPAFLEGYSGAAFWGDADNDGDPDVLLTGRIRPPSPTGPWQALAKIYRNSQGTFTPLPDVLFQDSAVRGAWGDEDADGDLDLILAGHNVAPRLYRNQARSVNAAPGPPRDLLAVRNGNRVSLRWRPAGDDRTLTRALTYNLRVGTTPGGREVIAPLSDLVNGWRFVARMGNMQEGTRASLDLPYGT